MAEDIIIRDLSVSGNTVKADLRLSGGRLHALFDPTGRDASLLTEALSGRIPHTGSVLFNNTEASTASPADAAGSGIGGTESIIDEYTLIENLKLCLPSLSGKALRNEIDRYAFISDGLSMRMKAGALSPVDRIRFRLLRSLIRRDRLILLPWPLSALEDKEKQVIKPFLLRCAENRRQILYTADTVSDALDAQDITVLIRGSAVYSGPCTPDVREKLIDTYRRYPVYPEIRKETVPGGVLIAAKGIWADKKPRLEDIHLEIREGEITGILYHPGSGEIALADCLCARRRPDAGRVVYGGFHVGKIRGTDLARRGLKYIPPFEEGPYPRPAGNAMEYTAQLRYSSSLLWPGGMLDRKRAEELTGYLLDQFEIGHTPLTPLSEFTRNDLRALSVAVQLNREGPVLIAFDIFEGLNRKQTSVAADLIKKDRGHKKGILLFSTMASKVYPVSDRVFILRDGRLTRDLSV